MTQKTRSPAPDKDVYRRITDHIIAAVEAGAGTWKMPWHNASGSVRPVNATSGKAYRGVNVVALWATAQERGYDGHRWATYKQWAEMGAQVRKAERSALVVFWKVKDGRDDDGGTEEQPPEVTSDRPGRRLILARGYAVFNAAQVDGYTPPDAPPPAPVAERVDDAEQFFGSTRMEVRHGGNRAFFQPSTDRVQMPPFEAFPDPVGYYATLAHEATHWTGAKARLDRDLSGRFGSDAYAIEELVAELGAAFLCADLGLSHEPRPDHAAYVTSWLKVLRADARAIFTAAAKAQQAADFLHGLQYAVPAPQPQAEPVELRDVLARQQQQIGLPFDP